MSNSHTVGPEYTEIYNTGSHGVELERTTKRRINSQSQYNHNHKNHNHT